MQNHNYHEIIKFNLSTLYLKYKGKDVFKARAYKKALDNLPDNISSEEDIHNIGGDKINDKIKYIIKTNKNLEEVDETIVDPEFEVINTLMTIHGIGPSKANELYKKHEITSIDKLRENEHLLNEVQKKGLKYLEYTQKRIPRKEMIKHDKYLQENMEQQQYKITGSYMRNESSSGDIDVLISGQVNNLKTIVDKLIDKKYIVEDGILAYGEVKFMGICKLPKYANFRRIDIMYTPPREYPFAELYFTGNYKFNTEMRKHALTLGYSLNEQGLSDIKTGNLIEHEFKTEKDIFTFLNYKYILPENRTY